MHWSRVGFVCNCAKGACGTQARFGALRIGYTRLLRGAPQIRPTLCLSVCLARLFLSRYCNKLAETFCVNSDWWGNFCLSIGAVVPTTAKTRWCFETQDPHVRIHQCSSICLWRIVFQRFAFAYFYDCIEHGWDDLILIPLGRRPDHASLSASDNSRVSAYPPGQLTRATNPTYKELLLYL